MKPLCKNYKEEMNKICSNLRRSFDSIWYKAEWMGHPINKICTSEKQEELEFVMKKKRKKEKKKELPVYLNGKLVSLLELVFTS